MPRHIDNRQANCAGFPGEVRPSTHRSARRILRAIDKSFNDASPGARAALRSVLRLFAKQPSAPSAGFGEADYARNCLLLGREVHVFRRWVPLEVQIPAEPRSATAGANVQRTTPSLPRVCRDVLLVGAVWEEGNSRHTSNLGPVCLTAVRFLARTLPG